MDAAIASIGLIGLGKMGGPIARHLVKAGFAVHGVDVNPAALEIARANHVEIAATSAQAAAKSDLIIVLTAYEHQVEEVIFGAHGVVEGARPGAIVAVGATINPATQRAFAKRLEAQGLGPWSMYHEPGSFASRTTDRGQGTPGYLRVLFIPYPKHYTGPMTQTSDPQLSDDPIDGASSHPLKDNAPWLSAIGLGTRFGPDWPGKRCLAKTRRGTECQRPAITGSGRCSLHGGRSTGPRTEEGRARISAANMKHGRKTKERLAEAKARAQANREIWYALKTQIELAIRDG